MAAKNLSVSQQMMETIKQSSSAQHTALLKAIKKQGDGFVISKKEFFRNLVLFTPDQLILFCDDNDGLRLALRALDPPVIVPQQTAIEPREKDSEDAAVNPVLSGRTLPVPEVLQKLPVTDDQAAEIRLGAQSAEHSLPSNETMKNSGREVSGSDSISLPDSIGNSPDKTQQKAVFNKKETAGTSPFSHAGTITSPRVTEIAAEQSPVKEITKKNSVSPQEPSITQVSAKKWSNAAHAVAGKSHLRVYPPVPCQDAAIALVGPYPAVIVCDGAGSSPLSHIGAVKVSEGLSILASSLAPLHAVMLDQDKSSAFTEREYVTIWIKYAVETVRQLTQQLAHPFSAFRSTLLLAVAGKKRVFWLQIGDGFIIFERGNKLFPAAPPVKGEYANETSFLAEKLNSSEFAFGFEPAQEITGIIAFTDGAGERLISNDGTRIAGKLGLMLEELRLGKLNGDDIRSFLSDAAVWSGTSGDDKSIAMISSAGN